MWLNALALLILGWFAWKGARRGGLASGMGLTTLAVSYGAAIAAAPRLGPWISAQFEISEFFALPLAGSLGFAAAFGVMVAITAFACRRSAPADDEGRSIRDRFLGGAFGATRGALVVLLLSYLLLWIDALRVTGVAEGLPEMGDSMTAAITETVVEAVVESVLEDSGRAGHVMARLAARPGAALADLQAVVENRHITAVQSDGLFWANLEAGAVTAAINTRSFINLSNDAELREQMANIGLIDAEAADDPSRFRAAMDEVLREVAPRIRGLRNNPELHELLEDPEVVAMVESGDTFGLIGHPRIQALVASVAETPTLD
jgi:uncharacterized membrane protein required for colicin V production